MSKTPEFNPQQKRPLELRVLDRSRDGGVSEKEAKPRGGHAADALVVIRFYVDGDVVGAQINAMNGSTRKDLSVESLFGAWLRLTAYIIAQPADADWRKRQGFLAYVLKLLGLDEKLGVIQTASGYAPVGQCPPEGGSEPTSG